ncbi:IclR family transcriptional regulator [Nocardioides jishulii]|uniref:IclR family transcriptional regulator n=1 Tax=Nocardioides jishulii TaxID=2575440 RepID=A0A4U2YJW8_9ACTN|nr:IclR family transcriptional regulator [Nocardioides jishulii]QCX28130.1 IclR family transcriptional regulator [Nocardioides jishulii]TKI60795.1 IclR family transcriptional regulator [Nocardioides jishulii]
MTGRTTATAARPADVLMLFLDDADSLGISEIARRLQVSKAVVHRIVTTFVERGLLTPCPLGQGYSLGAAAVALGARASRSSALRAAARPELSRLQATTGESAVLSAVAGDQYVVIAQEESANEVRRTVEVGRRFPLHTGSTGRCILAFQPEDRSARLLDEVAPDDDCLRAEIDGVRVRGWTQSPAHPIHGTVSVAAPVLDGDGTAVGALSVCGPAQRMGEAVRPEHARAVVTAAHRASQLLGWRGGLPAALSG